MELYYSSSLFLFNWQFGLIYEKFRAYSYIERSYFVGWIDRATLINNIEKKKNKTWKFGYREFWECKLKSEAKKPKDIVDYLKKLPY